MRDLTSANAVRRMRKIKLEHSFGYGVAREAGGRMDIQFFHQALPVFFDRLHADSEFGRKATRTNALRPNSE